MAHGFSGLDACVHCGFCLQSCPTYLVTADEADSPRGRIVLMRGLAAGRLDPSDQAVATHLDRCLGCRACEPVCPSGVRYAPALEEARHRLAAARPIPLSVRLILAVMAEPALRFPALLGARFLRPLSGVFAGPSRMGFAFGMLAASKPLNRRTGGPADGGSAPPANPRPARQPVRPGAGAPGDGASAGLPARRSVALFRGCVMDGLFRHVHAATTRVLAANGFEVLEIPGQACCGALHAHVGDRDGARVLARRNLAAFRDLPAGVAIAVNAAGCGAMLKEYGRLLEGEPLAAEARALAARAKDVSELLAAQGPRPGGPLELRVAYDPPCHLLHAQGVAAEVEKVLGAVPGLDRVRHVEAELCCGSAGSYSFAEPGMSRAVLARKVAALRAAAPHAVVTGNPGCAMQIGAGLAAQGDRTRVLHPVELLDWSYLVGGIYDDSAGN
jgi:glycolate oxidase iron-sulfur subunit